jgi:hypothetical protein
VFDDPLIWGSEDRPTGGPGPGPQVIPAGLHRADTSATARVTRTPVRAELDRLGGLGLPATSVTVGPEVGFSARGPGGYLRTASARPITCMAGEGRVDATPVTYAD